MREYGESAAEHGFTPVTTEHPKDLVLRTDDAEYLVEAKVIRNGNSTQAVREAIGQLFTYRFFLYSGEPPKGLVGLFSEPLGEGYVKFLTSHNILVVWHEGGEWKGNQAAVQSHLASR